MSLYNCKSTPSHEVYRITKLTPDLEVESSYLTGPKTCGCPGFAKRNACRHRGIRTLFMTSGHIDDEWLLDFDTQQWTRNPAAASLDLATAKIVESELISSHERSEGRVLTLPEGVDVISFDDPALMHKVIGEAVGEPYGIGPQMAAVEEQKRDNERLRAKLTTDEALGVGVSATPAPAPVVEQQPCAPTGVPPHERSEVKDPPAKAPSPTKTLLRGRKL